MTTTTRLCPRPATHPFTPVASSAQASLYCGTSLVASRAQFGPVSNHRGSQALSKEAWAEPRAFSTLVTSTDGYGRRPVYFAVALCKRPTIGCPPFAFASALAFVLVLTIIRERGSLPGRRPSLSIHSMLNLAIVLALSSSSLIAPAHCSPVDWLRKLAGPTGPGGVRDDSSWLWGWAWASDGSVSVVDRTPPVTFPARPASFGVELADPLLGYVIPLSSFTAPCPKVPTNETVLSHPFEADPILGCPDLCISGAHQPEDADTWIALVQRGGCPFVEKARQAQRLGAKAVVVGGDRGNPDALLNMFSEQDASDVSIAATYIKYWDYVQLSAMIATSNTTHNSLKTLSLLISTEYSAWEWYSPIITFIIILLLPSLLTFLTLLVHRIRAARAAQRDRAPEDIVHKFPSRVWTGTGWEKLETLFTPAGTADAGGPPDLERGLDASSSSHDQQLPAWVEEQVECAICLEMFVKGDRVRVLPCYHLFHIDEIDEWLIHKKKLCPICKADVTKPPHSQHSTPSAETHDDQPVPSRAPSSSAQADERTPLLRPPSDPQTDSSSSS